IAEDIVLLDDDVALVNPDTELDALLRGHLSVPLGDSPLELERATQRIDDAHELYQQPSPVVLTIRPRCSTILGSTSCRRSASRSARVPSSSVPMRRLYPATSAARMAARRRSARSLGKASSHSVSSLLQLFGASY